jgi:6,7-dimethyl-8-ribityllumazine synthase
LAICFTLTILKIDFATATTKLRLDTSQSTDQATHSAYGFRFAIVASRWNDSLVSRLVDGALEALKESSAEDKSIQTYRVPGSFELSLCALKAAESGKFDAVICLGVIIRGETPHFDFVATETARGINEVALKTGVPAMFGVITANTVEQATARAGVKQDNKGYEAAMAAVELVNLYRGSFAQGKN